MNRLRFRFLKAALVALLLLSDTLNSLLSLFVCSRFLRTRRTTVKLENLLYKIKCAALEIVRRLSTPNDGCKQNEDETQEAFFENDDLAVSDN